MDQQPPTGFSPRSLTLNGRVRVAAGPAEAFPLFSPLGEKRWVPGWDPEVLHPAGSEWEEGQIFRTSEQTGIAIWVVSRLDRAAHHVVYHRIEPGRYVARIEVRCRAAAAGGTEATVAYSFVGLAERGNADIQAMSQHDYEAKMARWTSWIDACLQARPGP